MPRFYLCLIEQEYVTEDLEGLSFADMPAAVSDAIRQIRSMVSLEIVESGKLNLDRAIEVLGEGGASRRVAFSEAISVSV